MRQLAIAAAVALLAIPSHAYYHYVHFGSRTAPFNPQYEKFANKTVTFFVSDQGPAVFAPNDTFGSLLGQVKQALAAWDSVSTSDLRVVFGGLQTRGQFSNTPGGDVVFDDLPPGLLGMGAPLANGTTIVRSTVTLARNTNGGAGPSYYEAFFTTAVHEVGHALGLQHTWTSSAMSQDVIRSTSRARPLDADDVAALSVLYGRANWQADYGSISGRVALSNGQPVALASVVAINPAGLAISALTNPDGTYRIEGIPPSNYLLYVHPLPPDAVPADESGIRLPRDQNNQPIAPTAGAFATVFFPGTTEVSQAQTISLSRGTAETRNFSVQPRSSVPAYDLIAYSYLDIATGRSFWDDNGVTNRTWAAVSPAMIDITQSAVTLSVRASFGDTPIPQFATLLGGFANTPRGEFLRPFPDQLTGRQSLRLDLGIPLFTDIGPRHLVLNYGNDMYVLPAAVNLVQRPVPTVSAVNGNSDGTVTVSGRNLDPRVYFDGLPATVISASTNSIAVIAPPGIGGHVAIVSVFNSDGQNSTMLGQPFQTYTYPPSPAPQIASISVRSLPAGATSVIDIAAPNARFIDGQVTLGFGSDDVTVERLWVTGPATLRANVAVAGNAFLGASEISVISGFQVMAQPAAFSVQSGNPSLPVMALPIGNGDPAQQTMFPGSTASIYGFNFGQNAGAIQVTLNDQLVPVLGVAADHVNIQIPTNTPTGLAVVKMTIGSAAANPVLMQIDSPPPGIVRITNSSGVNYDATHFAAAGDSMNIVVTGLDPAIAAQNNLSRLGITVSGIPMTPLEVASLGGGLYQIRFVLTQGFGSTMVPLAVVVDGSASVPYLLPIR